MKTRWYFSTLIIALVLIAGVSINNSAITPNQIIVLNFVNGGTEAVSSNKTITIVEDQLRLLGADNIKTTILDDGQISFTYFSNTDIESIKKTLFNKGAISSTFTNYHHGENQNKFPVEEDQVAFNLDIYEIQDWNELETILGGKSAIKRSSEIQIYRLSYEPMPLIITDFCNYENKISVAYNFNHNIAIAIDLLSQNIPEVRAGPITNSI